MKKLISIVSCFAVIFASIAIDAAAVESSDSVDLLNEADGRVIETIAFPAQENGYPYTYAHDGDWDAPAHQCWLTRSDYSKQNYLQITFDQPYQLEKIVFCLRQGADNSWLRKGTMIQVSETEDFIDAPVLYDSANTDPGEDVIEAVVSEELSEKKFQYIRFCKPNGNVNPVGLTELQIFGIPSEFVGPSVQLVDLLEQQLQKESAYPSLMSAQYGYHLCRDGVWGKNPNNCWLSSGWNGTPYLQIELRKAFSIKEIKFSLRADVSASESSAYVRKNTVLWASNDPEFKTYDVLWDAGTEDPGEEIITASAQEKPYQYFRWTKSKGTDPVGLTELKIYGYDDSIVYNIDDILKIDITPSTVSFMKGYTSDDPDGNLDGCMNLRGSKSFGINIYAEKAICYFITAGYGTAATGQLMDVTVNGNKQIGSAPVDVTGEICTEGHAVGAINLNRGMNEIEFSLGAGSDGVVTMDTITLALTDSFQEETFKAWVQEDRVPNYSFKEMDNSGFYIAEGQKCATMQPGSWVEYDIYTSEERIVDVWVDVASPEKLAFSMSINGDVQISKEEIVSPSVDYTTFVTVVAKGVLIIPAGYSVIRYTQEGGAGNLRSLTFAETSRNEAIITNFEIQNEDGARMPYAVADGLKGYAVADIKKLGEVDENLVLIIAQYHDTSSLVQVAYTVADISQMQDRETKEFETEITLKGTGGYVKAFLMKADTLQPVCEAQWYADVSIFPDTILENNHVSYELATNVLNNDGVFYEEYGLHNEKYEIDAIFYEGYKDTKVFAYIGIPKAATPEHPVPAMVLVHGGVGKAERSWVQKWNDLGYAAIAMDLYGDGPEEDPSNPYNTGKKKHPYAGVAPWDFSSDFENAGMYQNVVNIINAHTLLRSIDSIDDSKIGITGISWGGITTTIVSGVDTRFLFAIPVYGCGYLDECKTYFHSSFNNENQSIAWDPANFAAKSEMPVMFVNGDSDEHFSINSTSLTYGITKDGYLSIHHGLGHSQALGDSIEQVYDFADQMFKGSNPYIKILEAAADNGILTIDCDIPDGTSIEQVTMYYITEAQLPSNGGNNVQWKTVTSYSESSGGRVVIDIPDEATYVYASIEDNRGAIMSTKFLKAKG